MFVSIKNLIAMYKHKISAAQRRTLPHIFTMLPLFLISFGSLQSCKKDEPEPEPTTPTPIYMEPITDIDGNVYHTVKIGNQVWTVENLRTSHYRNGDPIPYVGETQAWYKLSTDAYCDYSNNPDNAAEYGHLYNWHVLSDSRGLAPDGWRIPTHQDFDILKTYLGENNGGQLKETGTLHWLSPNYGATNTTGFAGLAAGSRSFDGSFEEMGRKLYLWTSLETGSNYAEAGVLSYGSDYLSLSGIYRKSTGLSVRLIKE